MKSELLNILLTLINNFFSWLLNKKQTAEEKKQQLKETSKTLDDVLQNGDLGDLNEIAAQLGDIKNEKNS